MKDQEDYERSKEAIRGQGEIIASIIAPLTMEQWYAPTKLEGWNVLTLVAHTMRAFVTIIDYSANPLDVPPVHDRISYYRFDGRLAGGAVSQRAVDAAARLNPETVPADFVRAMETALAILDKLPPTTVIKSIFGPIDLAEYAPSRLIELTIHGLDLTLALNQPAQFDPTAQAITVEILEALLDQPRPAELTDDLTFIKAASGRERYPGVHISAFS